MASRALRIAAGVVGIAADRAFKDVPLAAGHAGILGAPKDLRCGAGIAFPVVKEHHEAGSTARKARSCPEAMTC